MTTTVRTDTVFGSDTRTIDEVIALVTREASEGCAGDCCALAAQLDQCAQQEVARLWSSPIKAFVPLLAFRNVQDCIRRGHCLPTL